MRRMCWTLAVLALVASACGRDDDNGDPAPTTAAPPASTSTTADDDAAGEVAVVVAAGDIACGPNEDGVGDADQCQHGATADLAARLDPDAVLVLGDLQYQKGEYENFLASYDKTWGRLRERTYPAPGNHEYASRGAAGYYRYWGERAGDPARGYYAVDVGAWRILALNSNCRAVPCDAGGEQERWVRSQLASSPQCTLAFWHHPRYSSGLHGSDSTVEPLWAALAEGGADVVLAGHDHHYERFAPERGVRGFVVGTGGKSLYPVLRTLPGSESVSAANYGVLELRLGAGGYEWEFHATGGAPFTDTGRDRCR